MATGFLVSGTDLSTLLAPIGSFTPIAATGLLSGGTDLASIFAGASHGTAYGSTGFFKAGTDIGTLFAKAGSTGKTVVVVAGVAASGSDRTWGYENGSLGSLTSYNLSFGTTCTQVVSTTIGTILSIFTVEATTNPGQSAFTTISVTGTGVSSSLTSATATYTYSSGIASWVWDGNDTLIGGATSGDTYTATLT